jgi:hypothetical protein
MISSLPPQLKDLESDIRDIKLSMVLGESPEFTPDIKRLRKKNIIQNHKHWSIIKQWKGKAVLTGSAALYAFGLLDRLPNDIDFLVKDKPDIKLYNNRYPGMEGEMDLLGYYPDYKLGYNVDFFPLNSNTVIEKDGFLFHHPFEIIEAKARISNFRGGTPRSKSKDIYDIVDILKKIKPDFIPPSRSITF